MNRKLNFIIAEDPRTLPTNTLTDLCDYLSATVLEPQFAEAGHPWSRQFMDFFTFDSTCDPHGPTGTIHFQVPALFAGQAGELEQKIRRELSALGIRLGEIRRVSDPKQPNQQTISLPITENPTVLISPPSVNIGYNRGCIVMRDLLGYQPADGRYEFAAEDVLQRVSAVTDEAIVAAASSPLKGPQGVRRTPSAISMQSIRRCLHEIQQFALWACKHNYRTLVAG